MEDLVKRGLLTYAFLSVSFLFLEWAMRDLGANSPHNPAWILVSSIYNLFEWSWLCIVTLAVAFMAGTAIHNFISARQKAIEVRLRVKRDEEMAVANRLRGIQETRLANRLAKATQRQEALKRKEEKIRQHELTKKYRETLRRRTPQQAVDAAFKELCKGEI